MDKNKIFNVGFTTFIICLLILSGYLHHLIKSSRNGIIFCEDDVKQLVPKYITLNNFDELYLTKISWRDGSSIGMDFRYDVPCCNNYLTEFHKGTYKGENINHIYPSDKKRISYYKKLIKDDIVIGENTFQINNLILIESKKPIKPDFMDNHNLFQNIDKYNLEVNSNNYTIVKSTKFDTYQEYINDLGNKLILINQENFIITINDNTKISKESIINQIEDYKLKYNSYLNDIKEYDELFEYTKGASENIYEIYSYEIKQCNFL